jgi:hypothetical protein
VRLWRDADRPRINYGSTGSEAERVWLTFVFRSGVYLADFFPVPCSRQRGPLLDRAGLNAEFYLSQNPEWGRDPT